MKKRTLKLKRVFDVAAASVGAVVFMPAMLGTAAVMGVANRSFPLFFQKRAGKDGKSFTIFKIKTMKNTRDGQGVLLPDAKRTTKLGVFVRKSKLDELPQIFNVLKGDMSLVGPRPLLCEDAAVRADHSIRQSVRPGLTGPLQIFNVSGVSDKEYIERLSAQGAVKNLLYDLRIIAATPAALFKNRKVLPLKGEAPV